MSSPRPTLELELILAVRRARVGERWGESWGAPDPHDASSSRRRLMRVVFSCVGSLKSPICRAISRSGRVCLRLPVHLSGYHHNAVATCTPPAHTLRTTRLLIFNGRLGLSIVRVGARARALVCSRRSSSLVAQRGRCSSFVLMRRGGRCAAAIGRTVRFVASVCDDWSEVCDCVESDCDTHDP